MSTTHLLPLALLGLPFLSPAPLARGGGAVSDVAAVELSVVGCGSPAVVSTPTAGALGAVAADVVLPANGELASRRPLRRFLDHMECLARVHELHRRTLASTVADSRAFRRAELLARRDDPLRTFCEYAEDSVAYHEAHLDVVERQAIELAHARLPGYEVAEQARAEVFEALGDTYLLTQTFAAAPIVNGSVTQAITTGSGSGSIEAPVLWPYSFPGLDLGDAPDFVSAALASYNSNPLDGFFFSTRLAGAVDCAGQASLTVAGGVTYLTLWPDTVTDSGSLFAASDIAYARHVDAEYGPLDWLALLQLVRPSFDPPTWDPYDSDGMPRQGGGCANVIDCLLGAAQAFDTAIANAYAAYSQHVDAAWADFDADAAANAESAFGFFDCFSRAGWPGAMGGASYSDWQEYVAGFDAANQAELDQDLANAESNLRNAVCNAARALRDKVKDCIRDCPEYAWLGDFMDAWVAGQGC